MVAIQAVSWLPAASASSSTSLYNHVTRNTTFLGLFSFPNRLVCRLNTKFLYLKSFTWDFISLASPPVDLLVDVGIYLFRHVQTKAA